MTATDGWALAPGAGRPTPRPPKIATLGSSGFLGSRIARRAEQEGLAVAPVPGPRVAPQTCDGVGGGARRWERDNRQSFEALCRRLAGFDVVINAVGMARPRSADEASLQAANAIQPAVVAAACHRAGVRRLVHLSTAAVQGRIDPLDESPRHAPFSPYTRSKAAAERYLLDAPAACPPEVVLYRPASVHAPERPTTRRLARLAGQPVVPIAGDGSQPLPFALVENVVAGVVFSATWPTCPPIVVQPDEGITTRLLLELFGARRLLTVPASAVGVGLGALRRSSTRLPSLNTLTRGLELLLAGQRVAESSLNRAGFVAPGGHEAWERLASRLRRPATAAPRVPAPAPAVGARR